MGGGEGAVLPRVGHRGAKDNRMRSHFQSQLRVDSLSIPGQSRVSIFNTSVGNYINWFVP